MVGRGAGAKRLAPEKRKLPSESTLRVAIVGAGIGGCSAAHFLRQLSGDQLEVHVFEKASVGGRTDVIEFDGNGYESGGSVIDSRNQYLVEMAKQFGKCEPIIIGQAL